MSDMSAFERQVETVLQHAAGPSRPVDSAAITRTLAAHQTSGLLPSVTRPLRVEAPAILAKGGSSMFTTLKFVTASIVLALLGGLLLASGVFRTDDRLAAPAASSEVESATDGAAEAFPTGLFVATDVPDLFLEFSADGAGLVHLHPGSMEVGFTYATVGDLWTEMINDSTFSVDRQVPATYTWDFDGELLSFELWGEEVNPSSRGATMSHDYRYLPGQRIVVTAVQEIPAGKKAYETRLTKEIVEDTDAYADAFGSFSEVIGREAVVDIAAGQALTSDMLLPADTL